ncbi:MAG: PorT family protein [Bacteroidales bacterium]|jgi:hypothetical protein|nr:PorT family protein [Bacteroidales bacterium]
MKRLFITVVFTMIAAMSFAQFNLGAKMGMNFSKLATDREIMKESMQPGVDVGLFARLGFGNKFYLQPEVLYSFQSYKTEIDALGYNITSFKTKTHNVLVPILVGYKLFDAKLMNVRIFLGPNLGFNLANKAGNNEEGLANLTVMNIAGDIGIGIDVAMITLDVKYSYGFTSANKNTDVYKSHNNMFAISLGWKFL